MNCVKAFDKFLMYEEKHQWDKPYHHKWRPSKFGFCYRNQYWSRQHLPRTNPPDIYSLRRFWFGHLGHKMLQRQLPQDFVEVSFETEDECGTTDFISDSVVYGGEGKIVDFKFVWGYNFTKANKKDFDIESEKEGYCLQAVRYAMAFEKFKADIVMLDRSSVKDKLFEIDVEKWIPRVKDELEILRGFWKRERLPPGIPRKNWQCNYCDYKDKCFELDGDKVELMKRR